ncbi:MAG: hypothetical protein P1U69_02075 [Parvibaculaceae bacterium]|nr:hypothetical protein [Parvibaculaceae bacterium]HBM90010.1 hypothetical protein [Rhodobiaceae bacterium]|tara:strand:+ start:2819 stop:3745 length:927 start_codon:yes stop_codon:yes gene_type:complete
MWDFELLFEKSKLYARKGLDHNEPDSSEVPLWCILSLELLARAALAKKNVALLADPSSGDNILYACGFPGKKAPKSIPGKTVFHRCVVICEGFTERDYNLCLEWLNWRNEELHTGALPLEQLKTGDWLAEFYRVAGILLAYIGQSFETFLGQENAKVAEEMRSSLSDQKRNEAYALISEKKKDFNALCIDEKLSKIKLANELRAGDWKVRARAKDINCPACEGSAVVLGSHVRSTQPQDDEGELVQRDVWLPVKLLCYSCGLQLTEHAQLHGIGEGHQFSTTDYLDPKEYYQIEFDPADYYEPDYGND